MQRIAHSLGRFAAVVLPAFGLLLTLAHACGEEPRNPGMQVPASREDFHPALPLLDDQGRNVLSSRRPVSAMKTCGVCHDADYISRHCYHADLGLNGRFLPGTSPEARHAWDYTHGGVGYWNPLNYQRLSPPGDDKPDLGLADWLRVFGNRYPGGRLGILGFGDAPLAGRSPDSREPAAEAGGSDSKQASSDASNKEGSPRSEAGWDPDLQTTDLGRNAPRPWDWSASGAMEFNCFLCHLQQPDNVERVRTIRSGAFGWATTATLSRADVVAREEHGWTYLPSAFDADGKVQSPTFRLVRPTAEHCGQCHGKVHSGNRPLEMDVSLSDWSTLTKGQVFSGQRMSDSAINLRNKSQLSQPWDVHAAALLDCRHCHFSLDNPALFDPPSSGRPAHLAFEPRRLSFGEYLRQPSHQFAKGDTPQSGIAPQFSGTMRTCRDCHRADASHDWLPFRAVHMARLECETCHVPMVHAPAVRSIDWLTPRDGRPAIEWRGLERTVGAHSQTITGFRPAILPRRSADGRLRLGPYNLILASYWQENGPYTRPARLFDLAAALGSPTAPDDPQTDRGRVATPLEIAAALPTPTRGEGAAPPDLAAISRRLHEVGDKTPTAQFELYPIAIHHGVQPARSAVRDCAACHSSQSILGATFSLRSGQLTDKQVPTLVPRTGIPQAFRVTFSRHQDGEVRLEPIPEKAGFYVLGKSRRLWADIPGAAVLFGVVIAVLTHASLRVRAARRKKSRPRIAAEDAARQSSPDGADR